MALIPVFHVVATNMPIDANNATDIPMGLLVGLDANAQVAPCDGDTMWCVGLAADSRSTGITSFTAESGSALSRDPKTSYTGALGIGSFGAQQRFTQNRVSDDYNEVLASGKMTVYHSGGEFWTDQYELVQANGTTVCDYDPGDRLWPSGAGETAGSGEASTSREGRFTDELSTIAQVVGFVLQVPTAYPSGVPGTETGFNALPEGGNSLTWGTMLHVKLVV